jgi:hypothetical protein
MTLPTENFVPKVHPATRAVEPDDPLTLHATPVAGDPRVMLRYVVEEFAWMGWDVEMILRLFRDPEYPALYGLRHHFGESVLRQEIERCMGDRGVLRFQCTIQEETPSCGGPDVVEIAIPTRCRAQGK